MSWTWPSCSSTRWPRRWQPEEYTDTYRERLADLIDQKRQGKTIVVETEREVAAPVVDLLQALEASVSAARGSSRPARSARQAKASPSAAGPQRKAGPQSKAGPQRKAGPQSKAGPQRKAEPAALGDLSKEDLVRKAAELGIPGRTKMTRDELEKALRSASGGRRRRAS